MTLTSNIPRAINTPTVMEEYAADQKGYDQLMDAPAVTALSREHDQVTGNENLYRILLNRMAPLELPIVAGNESFLDSIKKGVTAAIQAVKDFFKWLWSFFTGKTEINKRKTSKLEEAITQHGVKEEEVAYPSSVGWINTKKGAPDANLSWLGTGIDEATKAVNHLEAYLTRLTKFCTFAGTLMAPGKEQPLKEAYDAFLLDEAKEFGIPKDGSAVKLFGTHTIAMGKDGRMQAGFVQPMFNAKSPPKFKTDKNVVGGLLTKSKALTKELEDVTKQAALLESVFIKALTASTKSVDDQNKSTKALADQIQGTVRTAMINIRMLKTTLFKASTAAVDILGACSKGGK